MSQNQVSSPFSESNIRKYFAIQSENQRNIEHVDAWRERERRGWGIGRRGRLGRGEVVSIRKA